MSMSKKDFIALADVLRATRPVGQTQLSLWETLCDELADYCKRQNSAFKRERWFDYIDRG